MIYQLISILEKKNMIIKISAFFFPHLIAICDFFFSSPQYTPQYLISNFQNKLIHKKPSNVRHRQSQFALHGATLLLLV